MEYETVFGEAAANALHSNFYVDDLLKSIEDLDSAKQLMKDVINICKSGGFHLTKFISNNKDLLLSVSENQRKMGVKYQDLSGDLPNEKALEFCWNLREDIFSFKLKLEARTLTKGVMLSMDLQHHLYSREEVFYKDFVIRTYSETVKSAVLQRKIGETGSLN